MADNCITSPVIVNFIVHPDFFHPLVLTRPRIMSYLMSSEAFNLESPYLLSACRIFCNYSILSHFYWSPGRPLRLIYLDILDMSSNCISTSLKSSAIRSIDNSLTLVLEHLLPSEVNYNFIVSLIDYIQLSHSYITSA